MWNLRLCGRHAAEASAEAAGIVLRGLKKLEYRGYDSWGIAVAHDGGVEAGEARRQDRRRPDVALPPSSVGLGHTRWATHGGVTERQRAPAPRLPRAAWRSSTTASSQNYRELRDTLDRLGPPLRSETDTEVIVHLLEDELARTPARARAARAGLMAVFRELRGAERGGGARRADRPARGRQERLADGARLGRRRELPGFRLQRAARAHPPGDLPGRRPGRADRAPAASASSTWPPAPSRARGQRGRVGGGGRPSSPATRIS